MKSFDTQQPSAEGSHSPRRRTGLLPAVIALTTGLMASQVMGATMPKAPPEGTFDAPLATLSGGSHVLSMEELNQMQGEMENRGKDGILASISANKGAIAGLGVAGISLLGFRHSEKKRKEREGREKH